MVASIMSRLFSRSLWMFVLLISLSGCVTTTTGGFAEKKDDQKALEASVQLARQYISSNQWDNAKRHLKNAVEIDDKSFEVHEALALVYQNTGETELAEESYRRAIDRAPTESRVRMNYAAFLYGQKQYEKAVGQLEIVVKDTLYTKRDIAFTNLARSYTVLQRYDEAEEAYRRAYMMNRNMPGLSLEIAGLYYLKEQYREAQRYYDEYRQQVQKQSAPALWLGIRLSAALNDRDSYSSYSLALRNLYPDSREYEEFRKLYGDQSR